MIFEKNININNLEISGIKCDTPSCNYSDDDVELSQYHEYVNKKCPKCSGILLTEADFSLVNKLVRISKYINSMADFLIPNYFLQKMKPTKSNTSIMTLEMNGTGKITKIKGEHDE